LEGMSVLVFSGTRPRLRDRVRANARILASTGKLLPYLAYQGAPRARLARVVVRGHDAGSSETLSQFCRQSTGSLWEAEEKHKSNSRLSARFAYSGVRARSLFRVQRSCDVSDVEVTLGPVRAVLAKARRSGLYWRLETAEAAASMHI